jgi:DNA repair protein RecO (recombination protein O)
LHRDDAHPDLFMHYGSLIARLANDDPIEPLLRGFELDLLREIGYALNLEYDSLSHEPLQASQLYEYHIGQGATPVESEKQDGLYFTGADLLAIGRLELDDGDMRKRAKRLLRNALNYHLDETGLQTRRIAAAMKR